MPIKQKTQERAIFCYSRKQRKHLVIHLEIQEMLFTIENEFQREWERRRVEGSRVKAERRVNAQRSQNIRCDQR